MFRLKSNVLAAIIVGIALGGAAWWLAETFGGNLVKRAAELHETGYRRSPVFVGMVDLGDHGVDQPFAVALKDQNLLVSSFNSDVVLELDSNLRYIRTVHLLEGKDASITGVAASGDRLFAVDHLGGELLIADYASGGRVEAFGFLPDKQTRMKPFGVAAAEGQLYLSDFQTRRVHAVSHEKIEGLKDEWELIVSIPTVERDSFHLKEPTFIGLTPDGRLLISDMALGNVQAYSCNGRPAHLFEREGEAGFYGPMGIAFDNLSSPEATGLVDTIFDPSGIFEQGRIHVVDGALAHVKVFDPFGAYLLLYGKELRRPAGIAIDQKRRLIFVADQDLGGIALYKY